MKKRLFALVTFVLALMASMCLTVFSASAEGAEPSVEIAKFNLAFEDNTYLKYAVRFDGVDDTKITEDNIGMLYWTDYSGGFTPGTEDYSSETTGYTTIGGVKHYVFEYTHLAAKQLTDYIYSVAYIELDGETYYSEPVKYSALEYAYNRLGKTSEGTTNEELKTLLNNMLAYGASAQQYFDYKEDRLATADFYQITLVGGTLDDGFASGLYLSTDEVTITAPETYSDMVFDHWTNNLDETVSTDNPMIVSNLIENVIHTANYKVDAKYSDGLEFASNGDGTCCVSGIGTCTDTDIVIPEVSPDGDKVTSIGAWAFNWCSSLASVVIPDSVISIGDSAFNSCRALRSIVVGDSVTSIGDSAFLNCFSLINVEIPDSVTSIGDSAFSECPFLTSITVDKNNPGYKSIDGNLYTIDGETFMQYAVGKTDNEFLIPDGVTDICDGAFSSCDSLTRVVIPDSVKSIGAWAFNWCDALTSVVIPDGVTIIGNSTFSSCRSLARIEIPDSVTSIGEYAFYNCNSLSDVYYTGSESDWANITIDSNNEYLKSATIHYNYGQRYSEGLAFTSNGDGTCYVSGIGTCTDTDIVIPEVSPDGDKVIMVGDSAFWDCRSITSVVTGKFVTGIGNYAFGWCESLTKIVISDGVTSIGKGLFSCCESLTSIEVEENNMSYKSIDGNLYTKDGSVLVSYAVGKVDACFTIPDSVTEIGDRSFGNCTNLTNIVIGNNVTSIGEYAFVGCSGIESIVIPDNVLNISDNAFNYCINLTSVVIGDGVTSIGEMAFYNCTKLVSIVISDSVTSIGEFAFNSCTNLVSVVIGESVTSIGRGAFSSCDSLTSVEVNENNTAYKSVDRNLYTYDESTLVLCITGKVDTTFTIPDNVTNIGDYALSGCIGLIRVVIGENVAIIGNNAFSKCTNLTSIVIGDRVTNISGAAFADCTSLTDIYYTGSEAEWTKIIVTSFYNDVLKSATIHYNYVPTEE